MWCSIFSFFFIDRDKERQRLRRVSTTCFEKPCAIVRKGGGYGVPAQAAAAAAHMVVGPGPGRRRHNSHDNGHFRAPALHTWGVPYSTTHPKTRFALGRGQKYPEPLPNLFFLCNSEEPACLEVPVSISKFPIPLWWGACGQMCMGARH